MTTVGLVGVGTMGQIFTDKLEDSDLEQVAFDIDEEKLAYATDRGARAADSAADLTRQSDVVLLSLPSNAAIEAAMEGEDGILEALDAGTVVVDTGTTKPSISRRNERLCEKAGGGFLEAPLTRALDLAMMIGGKEEYYEQATPVFDVLAGRHRRIGEVGKGQTLKLMKQMVEAGQEAAQAEAIEFAKDNDVDPELMNEFLEMGIWGKFFREPEGRIQGEGGVGAMGLRTKDLAAAVDIANETGTAIPLTNVVSEAHKGAFEHNPDKPHSHSGIITYWQVLNGNYEPPEE